MRAEIISVGTELILGEIVDSNARYVSEVLSSLGIELLYRVTVGDNSTQLGEALRTALSRADLIITIGGLGPTQDDLTKETIAQVLGEPMVVDYESEKHIRAFFERRGIPIIESNLKQALRPQSGVAIPNEIGTAPGLILEKNKKIIIALPGPPGELELQVQNSVIPYLSTKTKGQGVIVSRLIKTCGIGESAAEEKVKDLVTGSNPSMAPYAKSGEVHFRITAKAADRKSALQMIADLENKTYKRLKDFIYGTDDETLESVVVHMLIERGLKLALAESCTGGLIGHRITNVPGSSETLLAGITAYSNEAKTQFLGVPKNLIEQHGAVSPEVAEAMALGASKSTGADIGLAVTGIAGPGGGSIQKPIGLVYIGLSTPGGVETVRHMFSGRRTEIKERASTTALNMLRMKLIQSHNTY